MRTWIRRFVKVNYTILEVLFKRPFERCGSCRDGSVMSGQDVHLVVIFEEQGPIFWLDSWSLIRRFDDELVLGSFFLCSHLFFYQLFLLSILWHPLLNSSITIYIRRIKGKTGTNVTLQVSSISCIFFVWFFWCFPTPFRNAWFYRYSETYNDLSILSSSRKVQLPFHHSHYNHLPSMYQIVIHATCFGKTQKFPVKISHSLWTSCIHLSWSALTYWFSLIVSCFTEASVGDSLSCFRWSPLAILPSMDYLVRSKEILSLQKQEVQVISRKTILISGLSQGC